MSYFTQFQAGKPSFQEFTSSGAFTVPGGVDVVFITMCGGGGAGGGGTYAGGGGAGAYTLKRPYPVTSGASITVTIGAGGTGVLNDTGNSGGSTSFGSLTVSGGTGGARSGSNIRISGGVGGAQGGSAGPGDTIVPASSCGGTPGVSNPLTDAINQGGGAGGLFGDGAGASGAAAANTGAGGGGDSATSTGGNGGSGRCIVEWFL